MNTVSEALAVLKAQRAESKRIEESARAEVQRLDLAISALEGKPPPVPAVQSGPSVPEMIAAAAREFVKAHSTNGMSVVFDNKNLVQQAAALFSVPLPLLKRGVYSAVSKLIKTKVIRRCPGGFELVP